MNIEELRKKIDYIDNQILELIEKRYKLVKKVGKIKESSSAAIFVPERENNIIERLCSKSNLPKKTVSATFREIISGARLIENPITIAYHKNDPFSLIAAYSKFGSCINLISCNSETEALTYAENKINTYAVILMNGDASIASSIKIISEISVKNPSAPETDLKYFIWGKD